MDCLRVHAHVEKEDSIALADEVGLLVMCDFPLIFCYVFGAREEDAAFFRAPCWPAAGDGSIAGLAPSIGLWTVHNEPPWPASMQWFGEAHIHRRITR